MMRAGRALVVVLLVALIVGMGPAAWSQQVPRATCLDCHEAEGMRYAVIQGTPFIEIPQGQTQTLNVTVANPWLHEITSALVTVELGNDSAVAFDTPDALAINETVTLSPQNDNVTIPFKVQPGATGVVARMTQPEDTTGAGGIDVDTRLTTPEGEPATAPKDGAPDRTNPLADPRQPSAARTTEVYQFSGSEAATRGTGTWNLTLTLNSGSNQVDAEVDIDVYYNSTRSQSRLLSETVDEGQSAKVPFKIKGLEQGQADLGITTQLTAYYAHPSGLGAQDEGNHTLERQLNFTVGQSLELGDAGPAVPPTPPVNWKLNARIWGEATGFIGLFMIPLSLVLGGAFGRRNVLWVNKVARSARLRVLWHNTLSYFLLTITILHLILFLYEGVYDWSVGMVWGGLGTLSLLGLAITGGFQRWFARNMGYDRWRLLHISMAVGFVATVLVHVLVDGAHFDIFREALGLT